MTVETLILLLFIIMGTYLITGRGSWLIAGFNMLPEEDKKKYNTKALCKYMGKVMFGYAFSMVFFIIEDINNKTWLIPLGIVFIVGLTIHVLIYVNTGERFKK